MQTRRPSCMTWHLLPPVGSSYVWHHTECSPGASSREAPSTSRKQPGSPLGRVSIQRVAMTEAAPTISGESECAGACESGRGTATLATVTLMERTRWNPPPQSSAWAAMQGRGEASACRDAA